jgi:hypothetical protein
MTLILFWLMVVSALVCGFDVLFYTAFFVVAPGYGNGIMAWWPLVYLLSSGTEAAKLETMLRIGLEANAPTPLRVLISLMLLAGAVVEMVLAFTHYRVVAIEIMNKIRK